MTTLSVWPGKQFAIGEHYRVADDERADPRLRRAHVRLVEYRSSQWNLQPFKVLVLTGAQRGEYYWCMGSILKPM